MYALYRRLQLSTSQVVGTGWLPPVPDLRDYTEATPVVSELTDRLRQRQKRPKGKAKALPGKVDLRQWCSPIEDQGALGSCTAQAAVGVVEYFQQRAFGKHVDRSRLFVYKTTRNLLGVTGDTGAWLRNTMGALALCGLPEERFWPYSDRADEFDREPPAFVYALADNCEALKYFSHDPAGQAVSGAATLASVKKHIAAGVPSMFGFWGFGSFDSADAPGSIPFPCSNEKAEWGHAIVAVGYDDAKKITNTACNTTTQGALLIRNSWGKGWGDQGYGWLPYKYVEEQLALDFWSLLSLEWIDTGKFDLVP